MLTVGCVSKSVPQGLSNSFMYLMIIFWSEAKVFITSYDESYESMSYVTYITYVHLASQMKTSKYAFYWLFYVFESMRKKTDGGLASVFRYRTHPICSAGLSASAPQI